jgi:hypothetical protein
MAIYANALAVGIQGLAQAGVAENNAFNQAYAAAAARTNARNRRANATSHISAVKQDLILSNFAVQMKQRQAEAEATVAAAAAGVEGQSVEDVKYQTQVNESHRLAENKNRAEQSVQSALSEVYSQTSAMLAIDEPRSSYLGGALESFSRLDKQDIEMMGDFFLGKSDPQQDAIMNDIWAEQSVDTGTMIA